MKLINNMPFVDESHLPPVVDHVVVAKPIILDPTKMHSLERAGRGIVGSIEHEGKGIVGSLIKAAASIR